MGKCYNLSNTSASSEDNEGEAGIVEGKWRISGDSGEGMRIVDRELG